VRLWADRYKGSEILFQPSIVGLESAGITEIIETIFSQITTEQRNALASFVHLTGGNTKVPGFDLRMEAELRMLCEVGTPINVVRAYDHQLDAWRGGKQFAEELMQGSDLGAVTVTKALYEECGHHYLKEHFCSTTQYGEIKRK